MSGIDPTALHTMAGLNVFMDMVRKEALARQAYYSGQRKTSQEIEQEQIQAIKAAQSGVGRIFRASG